MLGPQTLLQDSCKYCPLACGNSCYLQSMCYPYLQICLKFMICRLCSTRVTSFLNLLNTLLYLLLLPPILSFHLKWSLIVYSSKVGEQSKLLQSLGPYLRTSRPILVYWTIHPFWQIVNIAEVIQQSFLYSQTCSVTARMHVQ